MVENLNYNDLFICVNFYKAARLETPTFREARLGKAYSRPHVFIKVYAYGAINKSNAVVGNIGLVKLFYTLTFMYISFNMKIF